MKISNIIKLRRVSSKQKKKKIEQDFQTILGKENYDQYKIETEKINQEAIQAIQDILTNFPPF